MLRKIRELYQPHAFGVLETMWGAGNSQFPAAYVGHEP